MSHLPNWEGNLNYMGWFTRSVKKIAVPANEAWAPCPKCKAHIHKNEWTKKLMVCPACNYHQRITAQERINLIIDSGTFEEIGKDIHPFDHLKFSDGKSTYVSKIEESKNKTGLNESIVTGHGSLNGIHIAIGVMDFRFLGGSLGSGTGEKIVKTAEYAHKKKIPLVIFSASGGARMQEGIISLMQMAKTCAAIAKLHENKIPYISVLTDPTTGGVSASYAMIGDVNIAEPCALIGFAGRRVIEETIKQKLPDDFQTAEYLLQHGFIDHIVNRSEMKEFIFKIIKYWQH